VREAATITARPQAGGGGTAPGLQRGRLKPFPEAAAPDAPALDLFVTGQAFRTKYLDQALEYVVNHPGVWTTTSDDIAEHYARTTAGPAPAA
jgi:hypothetical protein